MKKNLIFGLLAAAIITAILVVFIQNPYAPIIKAGAVDQQNGLSDQKTSLSDIKSSAVMNGISHNLILNTSLSNVGEKIMVYKPLPPDTSQETLRRLAREFGVIGTCDDGDKCAGIASEDGKQSVEIDKNSGRILYLNMDRKGRLNSVFDPKTVPSDEEATRIATTFLSKRGLLPEGAEAREVEHRETYTAVGDNSPTVSWEERVVWFGGTLNNLEVDIRDISVDVNADGNIIEVHSNWRDYEPYMEFPIKSPQEAFDELKLRGVAVGDNPSDVVLINQISLRYKSLGGAYSENYLSPVYRFRGQAILNGKSTQDVLEYVPALKNVPTELIAS